LQLHFKNSLKSTVLTEHLKANKIAKLIESGKLFHRSVGEKFALTLLHLHYIICMQILL